MNTQQLVERLQRIASGGGGWILWIMLALSVVSIAIMLERLLFFMSRRDDIDALTSKLITLLRAKDQAGATALLEKSKSVEAAVMRPCIEWTDCGPEAFREVVDAELTKQKKLLDRGTTFLGTIGNNGPFIGLVGTVLGVIQSFQQLGNQNKEAMGNVMVGIAESLIATGVGLVVAIPAVVAFNVINRSIGNVEANVNIMSKYVLAVLESRESHESHSEAAHAPAPEAHAGNGNGNGHGHPARVPAAPSSSPSILA